jgi:hypothetical protein
MPGILVAVLIAYGATVFLAPVFMFLYSLRLAFLPGYHFLIFTDEDRVRRTMLVRIKDAANADSVTLRFGTFGLDHDAVRYTGRYRIPTYEYILNRAEPIILGGSAAELQMSLDSAIEQQEKNNPPGKEIPENARINPVVIAEDQIASFSPKVAAIGFRNVARNRAMEQLIASFKSGLMNPANLVLIGAIVVVVAIVALGAYNQTQFAEIKQAMGITK